MKSLATLLNLYTTLSQNITSANQSLGLQLMGDQQRYLLQRYFDNERSFQTTTIGGATLLLSSAPNAGATSATLTVAWPYPSCTQLVNFAAPTTAITATTTASLASGATSATLAVAWPYTTGTFLTTFSNNQILPVTYTASSASITFMGSLSSAATTTLTLPSSSDSRTVTFTNNSTALSWAGGLLGFASTSISTVGVQRYLIPAVISKIKNDTVKVGQLNFVPAPVQTRTEWDLLNFLPYTSQITNYYYIYNGALEFFPIPSSTGNIIQFNYKARVPDFSTAFLFSDTSGTAYSAGSAVFDYQAGSLSGLAAGSINITGASTSWNTTGKFPLNTDVSYFNLYLNIAPMSGEGIWYPISTFNSDTTLTLATPIVSAPSTTSASHGYSIAQLPVLQEDFHDMLVNGSLMTYFNSIVKDKDKFEFNKEMYSLKNTLLEDYAGTKSVNVDLGASPQMVNPNLFPYGTGN